MAYAHIRTMLILGVLTLSSFANHGAAVYNGVFPMTFLLLLQTWLMMLSRPASIASVLNHVDHFLYNKITICQNV